MPTGERLKELGFDTVPNSIVLLGLGPSYQTYIGEILVKLGQPFAEEVWTINGGAVAFQCDRCFSIADLETDLHTIPHWARWLAKAKVPIYTSRAYPQFPSTITYPLDEIRKFVKMDLVFCNTGPMALAMAMWMGVKDIYLFGIDYTYPNIQIAEQGGQAFTFLLGMCKMMGIEFHIPQTSSLMGAVNNLKPQENGILAMKPYGYRDLELSVPYGKGEPNVVRPDGSPLQPRQRQADGSDGGAADQSHALQVHRIERPEILSPGGEGVRRAGNGVPAGEPAGGRDGHDQPNERGRKAGVRRRAGGAPAPGTGQTP